MPPAASESLPPTSLATVSPPPSPSPSPSCLSLFFPFFLPPPSAAFSTPLAGPAALSGGGELELSAAALFSSDTGGASLALLGASLSAFDDSAGLSPAVSSAWSKFLSLFLPEECFAVAAAAGASTEGVRDGVLSEVSAGSLDLEDLLLEFWVLLLVLLLLLLLLL